MLATLRAFFRLAIIWFVRYVHTQDDYWLITVTRWLVTCVSGQLMSDWLVRCYWLSCATCSLASSALRLAPFSERLLRGRALDTHDDTLSPKRIRTSPRQGMSVATVISENKAWSLETWAGLSLVSKSRMTASISWRSACWTIPLTFSTAEMCFLLRE